MPPSFSTAISIRKSRDKDESVQVFPNERALINFLISTISARDPDVIVGHNLLGFDLDTLLHRIQEKGLAKGAIFSSLGRLRRGKFPNLSTGAGKDSSFAIRHVFAGRLLCDTYLSAKEFLHERNYSLVELCKTQLGIENKVMEWNRCFFFVCLFFSIFIY